MPRRARHYQRFAHDARLVGLCLTMLCTGVMTARGEQPGINNKDWWLEQALTNLTKIDEPEQLSGASYALIHPLKNAGRPEEVARVATNIEEPQLRIFAEIAAAKAFLEGGNEERYLQILKAAESIALEGKRVNDLVRQYCESGHYSQATRLADRTPTPPRVSARFNFWRSHAYHIILQHLAAEGKVAEAMRFVEDQPWDGAKGMQSAYVAIAYETGRAGLAVETELVLKHIKGDKQRDNTYMNLSRALARVEIRGGLPTLEELAQAMNYANKIKDPATRGRTIDAVTSRQADQEADAVTLRTRIDTASTREEKVALSTRLVKRLCEEGKPAEAEEVIPSIIAIIKQSPRPAQTSKFGVFDDEGAIAVVEQLYLETTGPWLEQGKRDRALAAIARARRSYLAVIDKQPVSMMFSQPALLEAMAALDDQEGVQELIRERSEKASTAEKSMLVAFLIRMKKHDQANRMTDQIESDSFSGAAFARIAAAWFEADMVDRGKQVLAKLGTSRNDLTAYRTVARRLTDRGRMNELAEWLPEMPSPAARVDACVGAYNGLLSKEKQQVKAARRETLNRTEATQSSDALATKTLTRN